MYEIRDPHARPFYQNVQARFADTTKGCYSPGYQSRTAAVAVENSGPECHRLAQGFGKISRTTGVRDAQAGDSEPILDNFSGEPYPEARRMAGPFGDVLTARRRKRPGSGHRVDEHHPGNSTDGRRRDRRDAERRRLTHWVARPEAVEDSAAHLLTIRSSDGSRTLLRFGTTALPTRVNGFAR
jgi:hypothetical protein